MKIKIFYSWQSDLPNKTNRGFIKDALDKAVRSIRSDSELNLDEIEVDRDTLSVAGSPDIAHTIFDKILNCNIFVGDVSIINQQCKHADPVNGIEKECKSTPNPNVLIELGYAARHLDWTSIICVLNNEYGAIEKLPFDIKQRRILQYKMKVDQTDIASEKNILAEKFKDAIQAIVNLTESENRETLISPLNALIEELEHNLIAASASSGQDRNGKFLDNQYKRLIEQGVFSSLAEDLKLKVRGAYVAMSNANGAMDLMASQQPRSNSWAEASNIVNTAVRNAKPKIEEAGNSLKQFTDLLLNRNKNIP